MVAPIIDSPKTPVAQAALKPKLTITGTTFTVAGLAACMNSEAARQGIEFVNCNMLVGKSIVAMDSEGRASPKSFK